MWWAKDFPDWGIALAPVVALFAGKCRKRFTGPVCHPRGHGVAWERAENRTQALLTGHAKERGTGSKCTAERRGGLGFRNGTWDARENPTVDANCVQLNTTSDHWNSDAKSGAQVVQNAVEQVSATAGTPEKLKSQNVFNNNVMPRAASHNFHGQRDRLAEAGFEPARAHAPTGF